MKTYGVDLVWPPGDERPCFQYRNGHTLPARFVRWSNGKLHDRGREVGHYFDPRGNYRGPDADSVYPIFEVDEPALAENPPGYHRELWPVRDRVAVTVRVTVAWLLLWAILVNGHWFLTPFAAFFVWRCERAFARQWEDACRRFDEARRGQWKGC